MIEGLRSVDHMTDDEIIRPVELLPYNPEENDGNFDIKTDVALAFENGFWHADITAYSKGGKEGRPNADTAKIFRVNDKIYAAVMDGVTSKYPYQELGDLPGAVFASRTLRDEFGRDIEESGGLEDHIVHMNSALKEKTKHLHLIEGDQVHEPDFDRPSQLPSSTGTFVCVDPANNKLEIAHVGDSFVFIEYEDGRTETLSLDTNMVHDANTMHWIQEELLKKDPSISTFREAVDKYADEIRVFESKSFDEKNNPTKPTALGSDPEQYNYGTGIINGQDNLSRYIIRDDVPLSGIKSIFIGSDGIVPIGLSENRDPDRRKILDILRSGGVAALREERKKNAVEDASFQSDPRIKDMDDATGVFIELNKVEKRAEGEILEAA